MIDIAAAIDKMTEEETITLATLVTNKSLDIQATTAPHLEFEEIGAALLGLLAKGLLEICYIEGQGADIRLKEG